MIKPIEKKNCYDKHTEVGGTKSPPLPSLMSDRIKDTSVKVWYIMVHYAVNFFNP